MMFILQRYNGRHPAMTALRRELRVEGVDLTWIERWFHPAREVLAAKYAVESEASLTRAVQAMNADDVQNVRNWDRIAAAEASGRTASVVPH